MFLIFFVVLSVNQSSSCILFHPHPLSILVSFRSQKMFGKSLCCLKSINLKCQVSGKSIVKYIFTPVSCNACLSIQRIFNRQSTPSFYGRSQIRFVVYLIVLAYQKYQNRCLQTNFHLDIHVIVSFEKTFIFSLFFFLHF